MQSLNLENLRSDEFYLVAQNLSLEDLLRLCATSRQTDKFCREPKFINLINEKAREFDRSLHDKQSRPVIPYMMIVNRSEHEASTLKINHSIPGHDFTFVYDRMIYKLEHDPKNWHGTVAPGTENIKDYDLWKQEYESLKNPRRNTAVSTVRYGYFELVRIEEFVDDEPGSVNDDDAYEARSLLLPFSKQLGVVFRQRSPGSFMILIDKDLEHIKKIQDFVASIGAFPTYKDYEIYQRQKRDRIDYLLSNVLHGGYPYTLDMYGSDNKVYAKMEFYTKNDKFHIRETVYDHDPTLPKISSNVVKLSDNVYEASWNLDFRNASNDELVEIEDHVATYSENPRPLGAYGTMLKILEDYF